MNGSANTLRPVSDKSAPFPVPQAVSDLTQGQVVTGALVSELATRLESVLRYPPDEDKKAGSARSIGDSPLHEQLKHAIDTQFDINSNLRQLIDRLTV